MLYLIVILNGKYFYYTYEIGEVFVLLSLEEAQQKLEDYKLELQKELDDLKEQVSAIHSFLCVAIFYVLHESMHAGTQLICL